jgi:hypothetical protein
MEMKNLSEYQRYKNNFNIFDADIFDYFIVMKLQSSTKTIFKPLKSSENWLY